MQAHRCSVWSVRFHQLQNRRIHLVEQPDPSGMFTKHLWPRVQAHPHNIVQLVRQCRIGQRAADG
eukprot:599003-Lingulodinium_polyedra.AAC.1